MPERADRVERVRAGAPLRVGDVTLLPIERVVVVCSERAGRGLWAIAGVEPHALVVRDGGGVRVVAIDGAADSLEALRGNVPGLDALLDAPAAP